MVKLLNAHFVPIYTSNADYGKTGSASADEKKERDRIWREAAQKKLSSGTVHVYLLEPGTNAVFDSRHVASACEKDNLRKMLEKAVADRQVAAGEPVVKPVPQSKPPQTGEKDVRLHVVARGTGHGSWREFPGENWVVLSAAEQAALTRGSGDTIDAALAAKILTYFYPQTENNNTAASRIVEATLRKSPVKTDKAGTAFRLDGHVRLKHAFYPNRSDEKEVTAPVVGWVEYTAAGAVTSFRMATDGARYGKEAIDVVVKSEK